MLIILRNFTFLSLFGLMTAFQTVVFAENTVILEFTTPTCTVCRRMEPLVQQLIAKGYPIKQIDANIEPQLAEQYGVKAVPTFVVLTNGKTERIEGVLDGFSMERRLLASLEKDREFQPKQNIPTASQPAPIQPVSYIMAQPAARLDELQPKRLQSITSQQSPGNIPWLQATVRIRVESPSGHDWGTGTIIDARSGDVLILTCGHIFRDSKGLGRVEVDLYCGNSPQKVPGVCLKYDADKLDLALVKITPQFHVDVIPVAPPSVELCENMTLISVGCDNGANPTIREHRVRSLANVAPYVGASFHYIQVDNAPVQGRSGGGIFTANGLLVGVCVAGHTGDNEGLFVPASVVRQELDNAKLSCVYQSPSITRSQASPVVLAGGVTPIQNSTSQNTIPQSVAVTNTAIQQPVFFAENDKPNIIQPGFVGDARPSVNQSTPISSDVTDQLKPLTLQPLGYTETRLTDREGSSIAATRIEIATLEELQRRQQEGDEIIVIVRSKRKPEQPCEIIQLSDASPEFLEALIGTAITNTTTTPPMRQSLP